MVPLPSRDRKALPDPEVERLIEHVRQARNVTPRSVTTEEIIDRCIYSLVNEGARILEQGSHLELQISTSYMSTDTAFRRIAGGPCTNANEWAFIRRAPDGGVCLGG